MNCELKSKKQDIKSLHDTEETSFFLLILRSLDSGLIRNPEVTPALSGAYSHSEFTK